MERKVSVMIVSDYPAVRADLADRLELEGNITVVGNTAGDPSAVETAKLLRPDVILVDLDLDRRSVLHPDGFEITPLLKTASPRSTILTLSAAGWAGSWQAFQASGISAVFIKGTETSRLIDQIKNFTFSNERNNKMENTKVQQYVVKEQAESAALPREKAKARLAYIDIVRLVLTILVIMVHAAVTYGSIGDWTYEDPVQDEIGAILLSFFVISCQAFFMGLFFFFSGYFTPGSYERKGVLLFWKERMLRLALPMLAYTVIFSKIPNYIDATANGGLRLSFWQYFTQYFIVDMDEGPTWFLFAVLGFSLIYTLWRFATRNATVGERLNRLPSPNARTLLVIGLCMAAFTFIICQFLPLSEMYDVFGIFSLQLQFFPTYLILFAGGVLAFRNGWLEQFPAQSLRGWVIFSAVLLVFLPVFFILGGAADGQLDLFMSGLNWRCVVFCLWLGMACIAFSMALTLGARGSVQPASRLAAFAGPNNYAVYLIHPIVLVMITYALSFAAIPSLVKFALASAASVITCFALASVLRKLPGLRSIL